MTCKPTTPGTPDPRTFQARVFFHQVEWELPRYKGHTVLQPPVRLPSVGRVVPLPWRDVSPDSIRAIWKEIIDPFASKILGDYDEAFGSAFVQSLEYRRVFDKGHIPGLREAKKQAMEMIRLPESVPVNITIFETTNKPDYPQVLRVTPGGDYAHAFRMMAEPHLLESC